MIYSMTGFGKASLEENGRTVEIEVRSLNSRHLDLSIRLPKDFYSKELEVREIVRKNLTRGKVSVFVNFSRNGEEFSNFDLDETGLKAVSSLLKKMKEIAGIDSPITISELLEFQTMFLNENSEGEEAEFELIKKALQMALDDLLEMRKTEGKNLETELNSRLNIIEENLVKIEKTKNASVKEYFNAIVERASQLFDKLSKDEDRLYTELALLAEKADITEECVRLRSHIDMFRQTLKGNSEAGRRLNFIVQEMNREINTINSKTVSTEISQLGILIKEEIEKIREQIQNIE